MPKHKGKGKGSKPSGKRGASAGSGSTLVVLMGLPGSGKSTLSTALVKTDDRKEPWIRVSQDDLGNCAACRKVTEKMLKKGKHVVIDRCNVTKGERKMWVDIGKRMGACNIVLVVVDVDQETCISRVRARTGHPTLKADGPVEEVIGSFASRWQEPTRYEGFTRMTQVSSASEVREEIKRLRGA